MKVISILTILLFSILSYSQEKTYGIKAGYGLSNAYAPNGTLLIGDGLAGQDVSSFEYTRGFQVGITKRFDLEQEGFLNLTGQYAEYGFETGDDIIDLNYVEIDATAIAKFGNRDNILIGVGIGPAYLLSNTEGLEIDNQFDFRLNALIGVEILENVNLFVQGKAGWIGLSADSKIKSYMLTLNTEVYLF